jgi:hypothetical protein
MDLTSLEPLVGEWTQTARWPDGSEARGRVTFAWLEGGGYLIQHSVMDDPVPNSIAVIGPDLSGERLVQHYFDSRGVARVYDLSLADGVLTIERSGADQDFAQRLTGTFSADGRTITATLEIDQDGAGLAHDFALIYEKTA